MSGIYCRQHVSVAAQVPQATLAMDTGIESLTQAGKRTFIKVALRALRGLEFMRVARVGLQPGPLADGIEGLTRAGIQNLMKMALNSRVWD